MMDLENKLIEMLEKRGHSVVDTFNLDGLKEKYPRYYEFCAVLEETTGMKIMEMSENYEFKILDDVQVMMLEIEDCESIVEAELLAERIMHLCKEYAVLALECGGASEQDIEDFRGSYSDAVEEKIRPMFNNAFRAWLSK